MTALPPPLLALSPGTLVPDRAGEFLARVEEARRAGLDGVLLREPELDDRVVLELAREVRRRMEGGWLAIHDRVHVALAVRADAVHLGFRSLAARQVREIAGAEHLVVGLSTHRGDDPHEWLAADYVFHGPVRETPSKANVPNAPAVVGIEGLAEAVRASERPVWGLGGLAPADATLVREAGAAGLAVLSGVFGAARVAAATRAYLDAWESAA